MKNVFQHAENCGKPSNLPSKKMTPEWEVWIDPWHVLPETWTELGAMQKEASHNSPDKFKDGWKHSTPRLLEEVDFPWWNNADIDLYIRC